MGRREHFDAGAGQTSSVHEQEWYHGGDDPRTAGESLHIGTRAAAKARIDPSKWDPPAEFPHIGDAKMWAVRIKPGVSVHPRVHEDDNEAGSLGFHTGEHDVVLYRNTYEDPGSLSAVVKPSVIASVRRVRDSHAKQRAEYRRKAAENG